MISDRKQYIGIKNNIVFELFQFLFMLEWFLACISRFSAHIPTSFSVFMPNICCLDKLDNKHYAYRLKMMWEYGQKNEKYWQGSIPAHIRIGKVLNVVIFDTNNCLFPNSIKGTAVYSSDPSLNSVTCFPSLRTIASFPIKSILLT